MNKVSHSEMVREARRRLIAAAKEGDQAISAPELATQLRKHFKLSADAKVEENLSKLISSSAWLGFLDTPKFRFEPTRGRYGGITVIDCEADV